MMWGDGGWVGGWVGGRSRVGGGRVGGGKEDSWTRDFSERGSED